MTDREIIRTDRAPAAIGTYSQAVRVGDLIFVSGQIPLDPATGEVVSMDAEAQVARAFENLTAVIIAAGATLAEVVKLTVYLTDLGHFGLVNAAMAARFSEPYPARAAVQVAALPRGVQVELDAIVVRHG